MGMSSTEVNRIVVARDGWKCVHCGTASNLSIQHRRGRGAGGSKLLNTPDNLAAMCWQSNSGMESDADEKSEASARGWHIDRADPREAWEVPMWRWPGDWVELLPDGTFYYLRGPDDYREPRPDQLEPL